MFKNMASRWLAVSLFLTYTVFAAQSPEWKTFTSAEGRFSVLLPSKPKGENTTHNSPQGRITTHRFEVVDFDSVFIVAYVEFPANVNLDWDREGDSSLRDYLQQRGAKLLTKTKISLQGHPGFAFTAESVDLNESGKLRFAHKGRMFVVANRAYVLEAVTPDFGLDEVSREVEWFLSSFRLTAGN